MGSSIAFRCKKCGGPTSDFIADQGRPTQSWRFIVGAGKMYSPESVFHGYPDEAPMLDSLVKSRRVIAEAHARLGAGFLPEDDFGHMVYLCPRCMDFTQRFYFRLIRDKEEYEPDFRCSICKKGLIPVEVVDVMEKAPDAGMKVVRYLHPETEIAWRCPVCLSAELENDGSCAPRCWD